MKIVRAESKKWDKKETYNKRVFLSEKDLHSPGSLIQEIKIGSGDVVEEHYHKKQTEIFYFLTKQGYWIINDEKYFFEIGDLLVLEPEDKHKVVNNSSKDYTFLVFKINYEKDDLHWVN